ncbi:MAG: NAD(P)H-binding protein, partial [Verrucomicrobiota bacterium]
MNLSSKLPESVIIFGCGYVGTALAEQLLKHGVRVGALTRNPEKASMLEAMGVQHVSISDLDSHEWHGAVGDYAAAVNCV